MKKSIIILLLSLIPILSFATVRHQRAWLIDDLIDDFLDYYIPRNIKGCFRILNKTMEPENKELVKTLHEDSICNHEKFTNPHMDFYLNWIQTEERPSRLVKYFERKGFYDYDEIYETILVSYHRYLNGQEINLEKQNERFTERRKIRKEKQDKRNEEYALRLKMDTINGVYIPKDIEDCCVQLDKILSEKDKEYIKGLPKEDFFKNLHFGLGRWIRNNWGLWGGSRLQQYFFDKKVDHPDGMSSEILEAYYDWLNKE